MIRSRGDLATGRKMRMVGRRLRLTIVRKRVIMGFNHCLSLSLSLNPSRMRLRRRGNARLKRKRAIYRRGDSACRIFTIITLLSIPGVNLRDLYLYQLAMHHIIPLGIPIPTVY
jgi:hypothetical protein